MYARSEQHDARVRRASELTRPSRWAVRALCCLIVAFIAALMPVDIGYHLTSDANSSHTPHVIADIGGSRAYAAVEPIQDAPLYFLSECAEAAGLTPSQFVCAVSGTITSATGMMLARETGIELGDTLAHNLSSLVDAADYPDWETLDSQTQELWGSQANYQAAKFNSLLNAFGYSELAKDYYDNFTPGVGGKFEPTDSVLNSLKQIGRIGERWMMGLGNKFYTLSGMITNREAVYDYFGNPGMAGLTFNAVGISDWPSGIPPVQSLGIGSTQVIRTARASSGGIVYIGVWGTSSTKVYFWSCASDTAIGGSWRNYYVHMFSDSWFTWGAVRGDYESSEQPSITAHNEANHVVGDGYEYYEAWANPGMLGAEVIDSSMPINYFDIYADRMKAVDIMMRQGIASDGEPEPDLSGYPENQPDPNEEIYYPDGGISNNNTWNSYTTPTPVNRPDNPYNPGDLTGTDEWKDETEANVLPLAKIRFDKLFPFCLSYDVKNLFEKVEELTLPESESGVYNVVHIPFAREVFGEDSVFEIDLGPLHSLLLMVRPFVQILIAAGLIFSLVWFWRGILTG